MRRSLPLLLALFALLLTSGCRSIRRDVREALPEFLRSDPGEKEMEIFRTAKRSLSYGPEDVERQARRVATLRELAKGDDPSDTLDEIDLFLEEEPGSIYEEEVRFLEVTEWHRDGDYAESFVALRTFSAAYPVSDYGPQAVEMAIEMAGSFLRGERDHLWGLFSNEDDGRDILEWIVLTYPASPRAPDAQWELANHSMDDREFHTAITEFDFLVEAFPNSEWAPAALYYRGFCRDTLVKGIVYDPVMKKEARAAYERYLQTHPDGDFAQLARERRDALFEMEAEQLLATAEWYMDQDRPFGARFYLVEVITRYRGTRAAEAARKLLPAETAATVPEGEGEGDS